MFLFYIYISFFIQNLVKWTGEKGREKPEIWQNVRQSHSKCPRMWTDLNPNPQPIQSVITMISIAYFW